MRVRNRMELIAADTPEKRLLADNLLRACFQGQLPPIDLEKICAPKEDAELFYLLDIDGGAIGSIALRLLPNLPGVAEIRALAVSRAWRRGGLAQFMFDKTVAAARSRGVRRLQAVLHSELSEAAEFFAKNEFVPLDFTAEDEIPAGLYTVSRTL